MSRFDIVCARPLLLLLFIPLALLSLIPYFRTDRRKRGKMRYVLPLCIYMVTLAMAVLLVSGVRFRTENVNSGKNIIFLVDVSDSTGPALKNVEGYLSEALGGNEEGAFNVGLVAFGRGQETVDTGSDPAEAWKRYVSEGKFPDASATDISAALNYAASGLTDKNSARIILISDGIETDGNGLRTAEELLKDGIAVSGIYIDPADSSPEVQVNSMSLDRNVRAGTETLITVKASAKAGTYSGSAKIRLTDNGQTVGEADVRLSGEMTAEFRTEFGSDGLHVLKAEISAGNSDTFAANNAVYEYVYIEGGRKLLIVDGTGSEAAGLSEVLSGEFEITVCSPANVPGSQTELNAYTEVILMNVDAAALPGGFSGMLSDYVNIRGGALLVTGGDRSLMFGNMEGTEIAELLPVTLDGGNRSLELMIILDISNSMTKPMSTSTSNPRHTRMYYAKEGVKACLDALSDDDYVGIVTFSATANLLLPITPATADKDRILNIVNAIDNGAGTLYSVGLQTAQTALFNSNNQADAQHIIFITDGNPAGQDYGVYEPILRSMASRGITVSTVAIIDPQGAGKVIDGVPIDDQGDIESLKARVRNMATNGGGNYYFIEEGDRFTDIMYNETERLNSNPVSMDRVAPDFKDYSPAVAGIASLPAVDGHYRVSAKNGASVVLTADGDPLYTEWSAGAGKVACFATDLGSSFAARYTTNENGKKFLENAVLGLISEESGDRLAFERENLTTLVRFSSGTDDETNTARAFVTSPSGDRTDFYLTRTEDGYAGSFTADKPGIYTVNVREYDGSGREIANVTDYTPFSYSLEYDLGFSPNGYLNMLQLTSSGGGLFEAGDLILEQKPVLNEKYYDPAPVLIILIIVLFLFNIFFKKFIAPRK